MVAEVCNAGRGYVFWSRGKFKWLFRKALEDSVSSQRGQGSCVNVESNGFLGK